MESLTQVGILLSGIGAVFIIIGIIFLATTIIETEENTEEILKLLKKKSKNK